MSKRLQWSRSQDDTLRELWGRAAAAEIGEIIGVSNRAVTHRARRLGLKRLKSKLPPRAKQFYSTPSMPFDPIGRD